MLKKIFTIFLRDIKVNSRDFLTLYILVVPILLGFGIKFLAPTVNDTTVNLALLDGDDPEMVAYLEQFAKIELYKDVDSVIERIERRDNIVAILPEGDGYYIQTQGNEPESVVEMAKLLNTYVELDVDVENATAVIETFGRTEPPLKKMLVNLLILLTSILGGMLISINIVEEKADNTISAVNVTTISRTGFILGKSIVGMFLAVYGAIAILLINGFSDVNLGQIGLAIVSVTLLSVLIGFIEGINNDDVMNAAAGIKMLFLPLGAAVAAAELLSEQWQILFYWIPFYWTYKGNDAVLSYNASWPQIISYTVIVLALCGAVYYFLAPKIQKGLA
ncbi:MAG: ABC transporter permease [Chloroflexi bacterium]|nr:ABC transporter permease [Chloroflexota bacterium]